MTSSMSFLALVDLLELRFWSCLESKNKASTHRDSNIWFEHNISDSEIKIVD